MGGAKILVSGDMTVTAEGTLICIEEGSSSNGGAMIDFTQARDLAVALTAYLAATPDTPTEQESK